MGVRAKDLVAEAAFKFIQAFLKDVVVPNGVDSTKRLNNLFGRLFFGKVCRNRVLANCLKHGLKGGRLDKFIELGGIIRQLWNFRRDDRGVKEFSALIDARHARNIEIWVVLVNDATKKKFLANRDSGVVFGRRTRTN